MSQTTYVTVDHMGTTVNNLGISIMATVLMTGDRLYGVLRPFTRNTFCQSSKYRNLHLLTIFAFAFIVGVPRSRWSNRNKNMLFE